MIRLKSRLSAQVSHQQWLSWFQISLGSCVLGPGSSGTAYSGGLHRRCRTICSICKLQTLKLREYLSSDTFSTEPGRGSSEVGQLSWRDGYGRGRWLQGRWAAPLVNSCLSDHRTNHRRKLRRNEDSAIEVSTSRNDSYVFSSPEVAPSTECRKNLSGVSGASQLRIVPDCESTGPVALACLETRPLGIDIGRSQPKPPENGSCLGMRIRDCSSRRFIFILLPHGHCASAEGITVCRLRNATTFPFRCFLLPTQRRPFRCQPVERDRNFRLAELEGCLQAF